MLKQTLIGVFVIVFLTFAGCASEREIKVNDVPITVEEPDKDQIQADLIGSYFSQGEEQVWYFAALSEFDNVSINDKITRGDAIEYDVTFLLKDFELEKHFILEAFLVYKLINNHWQLRSYLVTDFQELALDTHLE
jgi:hypothetical protein